MADRCKTRRIIRLAAAKLLVARTAESIAVHLAAGCMVCTAAVCGKLFAGWSATISIAVLAILGLAGLPLLWPGVARRLCPPTHRGVSVGMFVVVACAGVATMFVAGGESLVPMCAWTLASAAVAGAIVELSFALNIGATSLAASWLDEKYHLAELLSTSRDLLSRGECGPAGDVVFSQAAAAARKSGATRDWMFAMGIGGWLASAGAAALLVLVLIGTSPGKRDDASRLARSLMELSQEDRQAVAQKMLVADSSSPAGEKMRQAGLIVVGQDDPEKLAEMIRQLEAAGYRKTDFVPGQILARIEQSENLPPDKNWTLSGEAGKTASGQSQSKPSLQMSVYVGPGDYPKVPAASDGNSAAPKPVAIDFNDAWPAARRAALQRIDSGKIPPDQIKLVRDYFSAEE